MRGRCISFPAAASFVFAVAVDLNPALCWAESDTPASDESTTAEQLTDEEWAVVQAAEAYLVEADAPEVPRPGLDISLEPGPFDAGLATRVDAAPGARAVRSGGQLARSELRVRGLGGPRLSILLDGVPLDDPAGGSVDLTELDSALLGRATLLRGPEASALAPGALAGALALETAPVRPGTSAALRTALGSQSTTRISSRLGVRQGDAAGAVSLLLGRSEGDFSFRPVSYSGGSALVGEPRTRANNDHTRYGGTATGQYQGDLVSSRALLHLTHHHGGVAGLAGLPLSNSRFDADSVLLGTRSELYMPGAVVGLELSGRSRDDHFVQPDTLAPLESHTRVSAGRALLTLDLMQVLSRVDGRIAAEVSRADLVELPGAGAGQTWLSHDGPIAAERTSGAVHARVRVELVERRLAVDSGLRIDAVTDVGVEPSWSVRATTALARGLFVESYAGRAFRPPTFYELHGPPMGYTRANPTLMPEDGVEAGLLLRWTADRLMAEAGLFGARMHNAILYLNRNAYEVRPENAGHVWRGGGELLVALQATALWNQSVALEALVSRIDVTGAPLPTTPALRLRSRSQLDLHSLSDLLPVRAYLDARAQSQSSSNLYGELTVPAQAALDLGVAAALTASSSLAFELRNLLDVETRVDLHQVPLPGRQFMATLVIGV